MCGVNMAQTILENGTIIGFRGDILLARYEQYLWHLWYIFGEWEAVCVQ